MIYLSEEKNKMLSEIIRDNICNLTII